MPPKAPKISQEEAKRLEEEKRKQQQQQARREEERKRYLGEKLQSTGLVLPASAYLIIDFKNKSLDFISEKLRECFQQLIPYLLSFKQEHTLNFILKELHYYIKDSENLFGKQNEPQKLMKHRIFIGIMSTVLLNGLSEQQQILKNKNIQEDQKLIKQLVNQHCKKINGQALLDKRDGLKILSYSAERYFGRYRLITMFDQFAKSKKQICSNIYIQTPKIYFNNPETKWEDLTEHKQEEKPIE